MKIKNITNTDFYIYIFSNIEYNFNNVKRIIDTVKDRTNITGFYKALVCVKNIGCFIELLKVEDSFYEKSFDCRIEFIERDIYYKTSDYYIVADYKEIKCIDGMYHVLVDNDFDKILEKVEFGEFVYGNEELLNNCCIV